MSSNLENIDCGMQFNSRLQNSVDCNSRLKNNVDCNSRLNNNVDCNSRLKNNDCHLKTVTVPRPSRKNDDVIQEHLL